MEVDGEGQDIPTGKFHPDKLLGRTAVIRGCSRSFTQLSQHVIDH